MLDLDAILRELSPREPIFHRREWGTSREDLLAMTDDDFWEIGASGKAYSRAFVIETLIERYRTPDSDDWSCRDFTVRRLGQDLYQLSYVLEQPGRMTRRTTLWRRAQTGWKIVFHQGTVMA